MSFLEYDTDELSFENQSSPGIHAATHKSENHDKDKIVDSRTGQAFL